MGNVCNERPSPMSTEDRPAPDQDTQETQPKPRRSRKRRILTVACLVLIALVLTVPIANLFVAPPHDTAMTEAAATHPEFADSAVILQENCLDCHSADTKLPFYANFPIAHEMISADIARGRKYINFSVAFAPPQGESYNEAALAQLEYALTDLTMPPLRYTIAHWNRALSSPERETVLSEVHTIRERHFAGEGAASEFKDSVLQPLPESVPVNEARAALGEKLYHDVRLSGDNTLSCASCHGLDLGGTDRKVVSTGINGQQGPINAPTVFNAVFNLAQFWDGRAADLAAQAAGPINNPVEMGSNWPQALGRLSADPEIVAAFKASYDDGLTPDSITHAIAEFEKTLVTPDCKLDRYLKGDSAALDADELAGLRLFQENACANCHVGKAMGGQSYELMGRAADYFGDRGHPTDADKGRASVTKSPDDEHKFKVPTLRNIALTAPYFHDGSRATLKDAVAAMAKYQAYREYTDAESKQVVKFLEALTGHYLGKQLK